MYLQEGGVKLSVVNEIGKEAVVAILGPGDFFGEGCLAGQSVRMGTATAITPSTVLAVEKEEMFKVLGEQHAMSNRFIEFMLARNIRSRRIWSISYSTPARSGCTHSVATGALRRARPASRSCFPSLSGGAGGDDRHNTILGSIFS